MMLKESIQSYSVRVEEAPGMSELIFSKFSSWIKLKKVVAWMLRFKQWLIQKSKLPVSVPNSTLKGQLTVEELKKAEHAIISCIQINSYKEELDTLKSGKKQIKNQSSLLNLDPVVINGVLCVGGRLKYLQTKTTNMKHPVILPKQTMWLT